MNKKGQKGVDLGLGAFLSIFIVIIVGVVLFQSVAQEAGSSTTLGSLTDSQITAPANGASYTFTDYKLLSGVSIRNESGTAIAAPNYTIANNQVVDGTVAVTLTVNSAEYQSVTWNVTATTAQATTYVSDSGARAMVSLIAIFFALAIAFIALKPTLESGVLQMGN